MSRTAPSSVTGKVSKFIDGVPHTGWFTEDFTLEEIKTLSVRERAPGPATAEHPAGRASRRS